MLSDIQIKKIDLEVDEIVSSKNIIDKLIKNEILNDNDKSKIQNILYNIGFDFETQLFLMKIFSIIIQFTRGFC